MTSEEFEVQIKILEAENKRLKDRIIELETAIKEFSHAIGEDVWMMVKIRSESWEVEATLFVFFYDMLSALKSCQFR